MTVCPGLGAPESCRVDRDRLMVPVGLAAAPLGAQGKPDRRFYFVLRRAKLRHQALETVARYNGRREVECMRCGIRQRQVLELAHVAYWEDSVKRGHGAERSQEAIRAPERFVILCRRCHLVCDLRGPGGKGKKRKKGELRLLHALLVAIGNIGRIVDQQD